MTFTWKKLTSGNSSEIFTVCSCRQKKLTICGRQATLPHEPSFKGHLLMLS